MERIVSHTLEKSSKISPGRLMSHPPMGATWGVMERCRKSGSSLIFGGFLRDVRNPSDRRPAVPSVDTTQINSTALCTNAKWEVKTQAHRNMHTNCGKERDAGDRRVRKMRSGKVTQRKTHLDREYPVQNPTRTINSRESFSDESPAASEE